MMKKLMIALVIINLMVGYARAQNQPGEIMNFDEGWRFRLGGILGAEDPKLNDADWRQVDLPHDWSIEDMPGTQSPFNRYAISQVGEGFTTQGTGWYRKTFVVPNSDKDKQVIIQFDGVYMNADVYVNGVHLGNHPYGYSSFYYNITPQLKIGEKNIIAVQVKNEGQNSRWYSGSGIYRHLWLKTVNPIHVAQWGVNITTPNVSEASATVNVKTSLINQGNQKAELNIITKFKNTEGVEIGKIGSTLTLEPGEQKEISKDFTVDHPKLWSCDAPYLYKAVTEVYINKEPINNEINEFGIRKISFDATNGFQLNGKTIKLKGGCFHNDNGPLGANAYDRAEERKVELLKASGFNAIRCSHNPPSPAFLTACDHLGMLVIDEAFDMWNYGKNPYDYHLYFKEWWQRDLENMIIRDRNHPSIIMWSIGNEIPEKGKPEGVETASKLADYVRNLDKTRPVTAAVNELGADKDPYFTTLDVCGYNYAIMDDYTDSNLYEQDHQRLPKRIMFGTESYPLEAFATWKAVEADPYVLGDFVWTAWDYIGEASIGWLGYPQKANFYPWNLAYCGDIDICGWKRPQSYYRDALWKTNQLSVFVKPPVPSFAINTNKAEWSKWNWADVVPEWNWKGYENKMFEVSIYSSCEKVELFLNGKSLGVKPTNKSNKYIATYMVPYHVGELKAVGYSGNKIVNTSIITTASAPTKIKLTADKKELKADNEDLSYIVVQLVDKNGNINPKAENLVHFTIIGDAKIAGVGNANPTSLESYQLPQRKAWKGRCMVVIKAGKTPGKIILKAQSAGLATSELNLNVQ